MKNWKTTQYNRSKNVYFSFFVCFVFSYYLITSSILYLHLLLNHISIDLHFTNYFWCRKTVSCTSDFKRYLFTLYHIISLSISLLPQLRFISWSSPPPLLFNWPRVQLYIKVHIYGLQWYIIHCFIYFGFTGCLYIHVLASIQREFPCYTKLSYKLELRMI